MPAMKTGYGASPVGGQGGYSAVPQGGNPAESEAWALIEAARRMSVACERLPADKGEIETAPWSEREVLREALRLNWRLWTLFQASLSLDDCPLPVEIRQNLLSLCNFIDKQTVSLLVTLDPALVKNLVEINRSIASGLMDSSKVASGVSAAPLREADAAASSSLTESA